MKLSPGCGEMIGKIVKFNKSMHGLKQASHEISFTLIPQVADGYASLLWFRAVSHRYLLFPDDGFTVSHHSKDNSLGLC